MHCSFTFIDWWLVLKKVPSWANMEKVLKNLVFNIILGNFKPKDKTNLLCSLQIMATSCSMAHKHKCVIVSCMIKDPTCFKFNQAIVAVWKF